MCLYLERVSVCIQYVYECICMFIPSVSLFCMCRSGMFVFISSTCEPYQVCVFVSGIICASTMYVCEHASVSVTSVSTSSTCLYPYVCIQHVCLCVSGMCESASGTFVSISSICVSHLCVCIRALCKLDFCPHPAPQPISCRLTCPTHS
jgi:hypothetical protein